jgi:hypothetical protein
MAISSQQRGLRFADGPPLDEVNQKQHDRDDQQDVEQPADV